MDIDLIMKKQPKQTPQESPFAPLLTKEAVESLSGGAYFQRGLQYFNDGNVERVTEHDNRIVASVMGSYPYTVTFTIKRGRLDYRCSCPLGHNNEFCKHCVAAALAWIESLAAAKTRGAASPTEKFKSLADGLANMERSELEKILVNLAMEDQQLQKKLQLRVTAAKDGGGNITALRDMIDQATDLEGYDEYRYDYDEEFGVSEDLEDLCRELEDLLASGKIGGEIIGLIEYAIKKLGEDLDHVEYLDDEISGFLEDLALLHQQACLALRPDPIALAERLFEGNMNEGWGAYLDSYRSYAKALGTKGRARFRELAEKEWKNAPPQEVINAGTRRIIVYPRITSIILEIADYEKDIDKQVEIMQRDISDLHGYFGIAEVYHNNKLYDKALEWAEKGAKKFPEEMWHQNYNFLIAEYLRHKRYDDALTTAWTWLTRQPSIESCQQLIKVAVSAKKEKLWREKAFAFLRWEGPGSEKIRPSTRGNRSILVEVLLAEKKIDQAWDEAVDGGCNDSLWMKLAAERGKSHPTDALWVYEAFIDELTESADRTSYERIVALLKLTAPLMKQLGQVDEFSAMVDGLRETWKRRRSFIELLNEAFPQKKMGKN